MKNTAHIFKKKYIWLFIILGLIFILFIALLHSDSLLFIKVFSVIFLIYCVNVLLLFCMQCWPAICCLMVFLAASLFVFHNPHFPKFKKWAKPFAFSGWLMIILVFFSNIHSAFSFPQNVHHLIINGHELDNDETKDLMKNVTMRFAPGLLWKGSFSGVAVMNSGKKEELKISVYGGFFQVQGENLFYYSFGTDNLYRTKWDTFTGRIGPVNEPG
jgi:hypothetical protein